MVYEGKGDGSPPISFEAWKLQLRKDCELQDKLLAFQALGDYVLQVLWERGCDPSVQAIIDGTSEYSSPV
jgi:hypothetical protein